MGGIGGAALVGYRMYNKRVDQSHASNSDPSVNCEMQRVLKARPDFDRLGAPEIPAVEVPNVGTPQPQTQAGLEGYPVSFRVPDYEMHFDTMDDRIKPHFVGPLGPENDPVVHW
jgi:hypothetical protein